MPEPIQCPECGAVLTPGQPQSLCPRCALRGALEISTDDTEPVPPSPPSPEAGERIGRYKLLEKIGEGGCGIVYMAEQEEPVRRRVALKVIKLGMDTKEVVARFEAERQALALMDHPHIAKVFDGGATETGRPYFVMELVRGLRITDYCDQKNLPTPQRLDLFMQVCQAVQHAHQKGIIHRDLKPSNILVTVNDGVPVPKVIDFGIAKATGQQLTDKTLFTKFHQFLGSPAYTSPEQAEMTSLDIDTRSDIYSLGVLLYELLTGRLPFESKELLAVGFEEMLRTIREKEPARPSARISTLAAAEQTTVAQQRQTDAPRLVHLIRGDLDWIVMKCLEKDRARRYETANGLAADVYRHLSNEPVLARPPGNLYRFQKTVRRHKLAFAAAGAILVSLVLGLAATTVMFFKEQAALGGEKAARTQVAQQKSEVERKNAELRAMLVEAARSDRLVAADKLRSGQDQSAFAHLARACDYDPTSALAAEMAFSVLGSWNHELPIAILEGHTNLVKSVQFSPDGTRIVSASFDKTAVVWDAITGRMLARLSGHTGEVHRAEYSPDGTRIITASNDKTARVWDADTGKMLTTLAGHSEGVGRPHFSPDGKRVVTVSYGEKTARVWDAQSGNVLLTLADDKRNRGIWTMAQFSPDGTRIVTAGVTNALLWDALTGKRLATLIGHTRDVRSARFNKSGTRIVTASADKTARVWDAQSGEVLLTLAGHEGESWGVENAEFSPDGTRIVTAGRGDKTVRIWEASTGKLLKTLAGHEGEVHHAQFSRDGDRILSVSWSKSDGTARLWDASTGKALATLAGHQDGVWSADFSPDGRHIVTASLDGTARLWDATTMHATAVKPNGLVELSPDGKLVAKASRERMARVWEVATGKTVATLVENTGKVIIARFNLSGTRIITWSFEGPARLWEISTGKVLATLTESTGVVAEFSSDGARVVSASASEPPRLWDAITGRMLGTLAKDTGDMSSAQFSLDGTRIVTRSHEGLLRVMDIATRKTLGVITNPSKGWQRSPGTTVAWDREKVRFWDTATLKELATFSGGAGEMWWARVSPDGTQIITSLVDGPTRLWDTTTGKELQTFDGHTGQAWGIFSPDNKLVVMVSTDQVVRVWDTRSGKETARFSGYTGEVDSVQFNLDGTRIITTSDTEPYRLWEATTGKLLATLGEGGSVSRSARFSPDGKRIITTPGGGGRFADLWDSATGNVLTKLAGHTGFVSSARFSQDGARIVTTSLDKTARVWDATNGELLATLGGREEEFSDAQFDSDGTRVVTRSRDSSVSVWDVLPKNTSPRPDWFPDFLRYLAQTRLNSNGELERLKLADWFTLEERLRGVLRASASTDTPYLRILRKYVRE